MARDYRPAGGKESRSTQLHYYSHLKAVCSYAEDIHSSNKKTARRSSESTRVLSCSPLHSSWCGPSLIGRFHHAPPNVSPNLPSGRAANGEFASVGEKIVNHLGAFVGITLPQQVWAVQDVRVHFWKLTLPESVEFFKYSFCMCVHSNWFCQESLVAPCRCPLCSSSTQHLAREAIKDSSKPIFWQALHFDEFIASVRNKQQENPRASQCPGWT